MSKFRSESISVLEHLLDADNIELLRGDLAKWKLILDKRTNNVLIAYQRPDGVFDKTRRDALVRMMLVVEELLGEHDRTTAARTPAGEPGLGADPAAAAGGEPQ